MRGRSRWVESCLVIGLALGASAEEQRGEAAPATPEELEQRLDRVIEQNQRLQESVHDLQRQVRDAVEPTSSPPPTSAGATPLLERPVGGASLQLIDLSLDVLAAVGGSTARDDEIELLQGGGHDPRQRGFTLQNVELSFLGAIDPYLIGETHLIYFLDPEGESQFEVEEAFVQTIALPFGLDDLGFQIEAGHFFTEFGRINPVHPHAWDWQDQPIVLSRFFGPDGMRGVGARLGWLLPVPWFSELHGGVQNAQGETMQSFLASDEAFEERPVGGRPFASAGTRSLADLVYLLRWVNGFELGDDWAGQIGLSGLYGPNATGSDGETWIYGADAVLKWTPATSDRGWPFLRIEGELARRRYRADRFFDPDTLVSFESETFTDWGGFLQLLWGFRRGWSVGIRGEYATGNDDTYAPESAFATRSEDPFRGDRVRVSPLLVFQPSEFSRLRLQYNADDADFLSGDDGAHSVWLGLEFLIGQHPAHRF
jgi:hypothetical protein